MKTSSTICFALFLAGVAVFLAQLWFSLWGPDLFVKILLTDGILFLVAFVVNFLLRENRQSEKINNGSGLDS